MIRRTLCLALMLIAMPPPASAQTTRKPQSGWTENKPAGSAGAVAAPLPPRRPESLPGAKPADPQGATVQPRTEPAKTRSANTTPAEAARPEGSDALPPSLACTAALSVSQGDGVSAIDQRKLNAGLERACHVEEPVLVRRLTYRQDETTHALVLEPPATLACDMAAALARWVQTGLQPLSAGHFSRRILSLRVGGGHECRRRNRSTAGPLSEHATGRALDIFAFVMEPQSLSDAGKDVGGKEVGGKRAGDGKLAASVRQPKTDAGDVTISVERPAGPRELAFVEAVRQSACGAFMTVLGPGSDAAHANHLHLDIQTRRSGSSKFCQ